VQTPNPASAYRYRVVDVFTSTALEGNALAVFPHASGLDDVTMQRIARELNLAETAFVFAPTRADCAAHVRFFTPAQELIFAGHPTIGTSYVLLDEGAVPRDAERFVLEEKVGPVAIRVERGERPMIWLRTPPIRDGEIAERAACAKALGLESDDLLDAAPQLLSAGNPTLYIACKDAATVDRASLDMGGLERLTRGSPEPRCIFVFAPFVQPFYAFLSSTLGWFPLFSGPVSPTGRQGTIAISETDLPPVREGCRSERRSRRRPCGETSHRHPRTRPAPG